MEALLLILGGVILIIIAIVYSSIVGGLVFYKFYYWFVLPVFTDMPHITFAMAIGLSFFTVVFKTIFIDELKDEYRDKSKHYVVYFYPWIILLLGWLLKLIIY